MRDLGELQARLGYTFRDTALLTMALTHPSLSNEAKQAIPDSQRLEFLGDAVLQLVLTDELYRRYGEASEGRLTKVRAHLVNRRTLSARGQSLELGHDLRMSRGEQACGGRQRPSALADAYEALMGAIYLDGGMEAARAVIHAQFADVWAGLEVGPHLDNPKGELQEWLQAQCNESPDYRVESATGPDHDRQFECAVFHRGRELGRGSGRSKKDAESMAAAAALRALRAASGPETSPDP